MSFNMSASPNRYKKKQQAGAVLLAVLVVALALVILLGVVSNALNNRIIIGQHAKDSLQDAALVYGKLNELTYLLATQRVTAAGVSTGVNQQGKLRDDEGHWVLNVIGDEIRADGFVYKLDNELHYSIQNEAGLISINSAGQFWLKQALASYGLSVVEQATFADILTDYADSDDWRRPAGAESFAYEKNNKPVPRNYLLQSCSELWRLQNWSEWLTGNSDWLTLCNISRSERLNINMVPVELWKKLWPASANKISIQRQQRQWLVSAGDTLLLEPNLGFVPEEYFSTIGGSFFQLLVYKGGFKQFRRVAVGEGKKEPIVIR
jgi:general secretion pathway protein K